MCDICPICLDKTNLDKKLHNSNHYVCEICYNKLREEKITKCPICRETINEDLVQKKNTHTVILPDRSRIVYTIINDEIVEELNYTINIYNQLVNINYNL